MRFGGIILLALLTATPSPGAVGTMQPDTEAAKAAVQQGMHFGVQGQFDRALDAFNRAIALDPGNAVSWIFRANTHFAMQHCDLAMPDFDQSIKLNPGIPQAYTGRGYCDLVTGHFETAADDFKQAIALKPDYPEAYNGLGNAHNEMKQYALAVVDLNKAIELKTDYGIAIGNRGWAYNGLGQNESALADFRRAAELAPKYWQMYRGMAIVHARMGDYPAAIKDADVWLKESPGNPEALNSRCYSRAAANTDLDAALADCSEALRALPRNPAILDSRAFVQFRKGDWHDAVSDADAALAIKPDAAPTLYLRGLAKRKLGDVAGGDNDIAAAKEVDAKIADTYAGYGVKP